MHTIIDTYKDVVEKYCQSKGRYLQQAQTVLQQLEAVRHFEDIYAFCLFPLPLEKSRFFFDRPLNKEDGWVKYHTTFVHYVTAIYQIDEARIRANLGYIEKTPRTTALIFLCETILAHSQYRLQENALELLRLLEDTEALNTIMAFLETQPEIPAPSKPRAGSFDAALPQNDAHRICLSLLRSNSGLSEDRKRTPCWNATNQFLQSLLLLYQNLYPRHRSLPSVPLDA